MQATTSADDPTLSAAEIEQFSKLAADWWNPTGPMRPLHAMNPSRIAWITDHLAAAIGPAARPAILDLGCGAGLAAETLARAGFPVLGLDAAGPAIDAARAHAAGQDLDLAYRLGRAEDLVAEGRRFPVITALEVIEHVPDPAVFLHLLAGLLEPNGYLFISTMNRTRKAWLTAKVGAEYVLRLLPRGTHEWRAFVTPAELGQHARQAGLRMADASGLLPQTNGGWRIGKDLSVNYIAMLAA